MMPEWQQRIIERMRANPGEAIPATAQALGISPNWLAMLANSDAFRALMRKEGVGPQTVSHVTVPTVPPAGPTAPDPLPLSQVADSLAGSTPPPAPTENGTEPKPAIATINYTHDAIIDMIIANPAIKKGEIARSFGYTQSWLSRIISSDVFQARLRERKAEVVDPSIVQSVEEAVASLVLHSVEVLHGRLDVNDVRAAGRALDSGTKFLAGLKAAAREATQINTYVALLPSKAADAEQWAATHRPKPLTIPNG